MNKVQLKFNEACKQWRLRKRAGEDMIGQMCGDEGDPKDIRVSITDTQQAISSGKSTAHACTSSARLLSPHCVAETFFLTRCLLFRCCLGEI